ncbi:hypothetical protein FB451DRAFT_1561404 [Mycena latifolia]|nr:hypothetical protein FB451DRAFT_1561404 [Mycena latifolia]
MHVKDTPAACYRAAAAQSSSPATGKLLRHAWTSASRSTPSPLEVRWQPLDSLLASTHFGSSFSTGALRPPTVHDPARTPAARRNSGVLCPCTVHMCPVRHPARTCFDAYAYFAPLGAHVHPRRAPYVRTDDLPADAYTPLRPVPAPHVRSESKRRIDFRARRADDVPSRAPRTHPAPHAAYDSATHTPRLLHAYHPLTHPHSRAIHPVPAAPHALPSCASSPRRAEFCPRSAAVRRGIDDARVPPHA